VNVAEPAHAHVHDEATRDLNEVQVTPKDEQECHDQRCAHRVLNPAEAVETLLEIGFVTFPVLKHSKVSASRQKGEVGSGAEESEFA